MCVTERERNRHTHSVGMCVPCLCVWKSELVLPTLFEAGSVFLLQTAGQLVHVLPGIPPSPPQSHPDWRLGCGCCCSTFCFSVGCGDVKMCCKCFLTQPSPWLAPIFLPSKVSPSFLHSFTLFLRCVRELSIPCFTQACVSGGWQRKRTETSASSGVCAVISFLLVLGIELRTWCMLSTC